jgi:hypothetical protein
MVERLWCSVPFDINDDRFTLLEYLWTQVEEEKVRTLAVDDHVHRAFECSEASGNARGHALFDVLFTFDQSFYCSWCV